MARLGGCGFRCAVCKRVFSRQKDRKHHRCSGRMVTASDDQAPSVRTIPGVGGPYGTNVGFAGGAVTSQGRKGARHEASPEVEQTNDSRSLIGLDPFSGSVEACDDMTSSQYARGRLQVHTTLIPSSKGSSGSSDDMSLTLGSNTDSDSDDDRTITLSEKGDSRDNLGSPI